MRADPAVPSLLARLAVAEGRRPARWWYLATAITGTVALVIQLVVSLAELPQPPLTRLITFAGFFSVQANLLVVVATAMLAVDPDRDGRPWRVVHLDGLLGITVTGLIYLLLLRPVMTFQGWAVVADLGLHYLVPLLAVAGWVLFGPRGRIGRGDVFAAMGWPLAWFTWTYLHGSVTGWYPYPFVDVGVGGYLATFGRSAVVVAVLLGLAVAAWLTDRRLLRAVRSTG